jgi:hypothetical protein
VETLGAGLSFASESNGAGLAHTSAGAVHAWAGTVALAPGGSVTVTLDATLACAASSVSASARASASGACGTGAEAGPSSDGFAVAAPGTLAAALRVSATAVAAGDTFTVELTVTNEGASAVAGVSATLLDDPALAAVVAGPPAGALTLGPGAATTFAWTYSAVGAGTAGFTASAAGQACPAAAATATAAASVEISAGAVPQLAVTAISAGVATAGLDQLVTVVMTVSNTGQALAATGVAPTSLALGGSGRVELVSGPVPSSTDLAPGESATFAWVYRTLQGGEVTFTGGATSDNGGSAPAVASAVPLRISEAGNSLADALVYPSPFVPSRAVGGTLKFRRMPADSRVRIYTIAGELVRGLDADGNGLAEWDGRNEDGTAAVPAVYIYVLQSPSGEKRVGKIEVGR